MRNTHFMKIDRHYSTITTFLHYQLTCRLNVSNFMLTDNTVFIKNTINILKKCVTAIFTLLNFGYCFCKKIYHDMVSLAQLEL